MKNPFTEFLQNPSIRPDFFEASYLDKEQRRERVLRASSRPLAPLLIAELKRQNPARSDAVKLSLEKISRPSVAMVVTGQQLGLFGGPLLTLYKALTAAKFARQLEEESGTPVVPLFWMQSEDHDYAEIKTALFLSADGEREAFSLEPQQHVPGCSVGKIGITAKMSTELATFVTQRGGDPGWQKALKEAYRPGATLASAYQTLMQQVLADAGVLIFDPLQDAVKSHYKDFIASSFLRASSIEKLLNDRAEFLRSRDYPVQVAVKPRSPLFFVEQQGKRERLTESADGSWQGSGWSLQKEELYRLLDTEPGRFTTSALIRPLFQDTLFPTVAYVAGLSEFNYWLQLKPLYEFFGIPQPLVVPRARLHALDHKAAKLWRKLNLNERELTLSTREFIAGRSSGSEYDPEKIFSPAATAMSQALDTAAPALCAADPQLASAISETKEANLRNLTRLRGKYERALSLKFSTQTEQFERIKKFLYPGGKEQERELCFMHFLLSEGNSFISRVYAAVDPLQDERIRVLQS